MTQRPPNCGTGHCSCIECFAPKVTVLPYMGKPKETDRERKRREYKAPRVVSDGVQRTPARIAPEWKE